MSYPELSVIIYSLIAVIAAMGIVCIKKEIRVDLVFTNLLVGFYYYIKERVQKEKSDS